MARPEYSTNALNVLNRFYRCSALVYVEGADDVPFWRAVFDNLGDANTRIEALGGRAELEKYVDRVENDDANLIIAMDLDYAQLAGTRQAHERVIYTPGYSIENSLYVAKIVSKVAHLCHRVTAPEESDVAQWLSQLASALRPLVICDISSQLNALGVPALGANCEPYMTSRRSPLVAEERVSERLKQLAKSVPAATTTHAEKVVDENGGYDIRLLRGHVLESAVLRYVSAHASRNVARETLYTNAISVFGIELPRNHPHRNYFRSAVRTALASIKE